MADKKISELTELTDVDDSDLIPVVDVSEDETKSVTLSNLKSSLSIDQVDNTSDSEKPISITTQAALNLKEDIFDPKNSTYVFDDFLLGSGTSGQIGSYGWNSFLSGTGAQIQSGNITGFSNGRTIGVVTLNTGTTSTGVSCLRLFGTAISFNNGSAVIETRIKVSKLATVAQDYVLRAGLGNYATSDHHNGVYFEYNDLISPNWILKTTSAGIRTQVITSVTVTPFAFVTLRAEVNNNGGLVTFFINGILAGTISTNIPIDNRTCAPNFHMIKTNGNEVRTTNIDYFYFNKIFNPPR
jgi:hypothetical protein